MTEMSITINIRILLIKYRKIIKIIYILITTLCLRDQLIARDQAILNRNKNYVKQDREGRGYFRKRL